MDPATYDLLQKVRASKTVYLKPTSSLRSDVVLRYYQSIGTYHLLKVPRMVLGDSMGLGKTCQVIAALCYIFDKNPKTPVIIFTTKSTLFQWASEFEKFTTNIRAVVVTGSQARRKKLYEKYFQGLKEGTGEVDILNPGVEASGPQVLVMGYDTLVRDWKQGAEVTKVGNKTSLSRGYLDAMTLDLKDLTLVCDEAAALKNPSSQRSETFKILSSRATRAWGLTATLLKNNLMEGFGIYRALVPDLFGTKTSFMDFYCHTRKIRRGMREVPIITGYKNLESFRQRIDPYFLGRQKQEVSKELPALITKEITFELTEAEHLKYKEALNGILELGDGTVKDYSETKAMTSLIYAQQVVDSLTLLKFKEGDTVLTPTLEEASLGDVSSKEAALLDLLTEDFDGEKVIVYTRFASHVPRLQALATKAGVKNVCITGSVKDKDREKAKKSFQEGDAQVIFITDAATEAVNLQKASAMIFFNSPWSWGQYMQGLGRMIRIGSPHSGVVAVHLVSKRPGGRHTIDHHVLKVLKSKKGLIEQVLGEGTVGALDFSSTTAGAEVGTKELLLQLKMDAAS